MAEMDDTGHAFLKRSLFLNSKSQLHTAREGRKAKLNVFTAYYYFFFTYFIHCRKKIKSEDKSELTEFMDVDGFAAHAFATFTHGFDLNQIVAVSGEGELHSSFVGEKSCDIIVVIFFQEHLGQKKNVNMLVQNHQPRA